MLRRKRLLIVGALLAIVGAAGGGFAIAGLSNNGVITGCVQKNSGAVRVIDSTVTGCKSNETKLDWNQQGQKGDPGQDGTNGTNGTNGVSGYEIVELSDEWTSNGGTFALADTVDCPAGKVLLGGGGRASSFQGNTSTGLAALRYSFPDEMDGTNRWAVAFGKRDGSVFAADEGLSYTIYAICATVAP